MAVVAIVGRPNVGKSTLFNRIVGKSAAIVQREPGVTRDRVYAEAEWAGQSFVVVDTGGIGLEEGVGTGLEKAVRKQAEIAIREADLVLLVVDAREGLTAADQEVVSLLRKAGKPFLLVANKADEPRLWDQQRAEFYRLGMEDAWMTSAEHGIGVGDLLDAVLDRLSEHRLTAGGEAVDREEAGESREGPSIAVAVAGRPNAGKSSLVNRLVDDERMIVDSAPGTTRDAVDVTVTFPGGEKITLVDTAGLRRRGKIGSEVERKSVIAALRAIHRADVVLLVVDVTEGVTDQDRRIAGFTDEAGKGLIVVGNKIDLVEAKEVSRKDLLRAFSAGLYFVDYAPIHFTSALTGEGIDALRNLILHVGRNRTMRVDAGVLRRILRDAVAMMPPPAQKRRRRARDLGAWTAAADNLQCFQKEGGPPTFVVGLPGVRSVEPSYLKYLTGRIKEVFGFTGNPIRVVAAGKPRQRRRLRGA